MFSFYNLSPTNKEYNDRQIASFKDSLPKRGGTCIEVALTDQQMSSGWAKVLKKAGFKLCHRFRNSNSGNYVSVLLFSAGRIRKAQPFEW
jgi:hypothetical protein